MCHTASGSFLGQNYIWVEFEHIASVASIAPCVGRIHDGRVNCYDLGAPDALYCAVGGGVSVWPIDLNGQWTFSFAVTQAQIEAALAQAHASGVNVLIGSDALGNALYALSDGQTLAFFGSDLREPGKSYQFTFAKLLCPVA